MEFLDKRIKGISDELKKLSVKQRTALDNWQYKEGSYIMPEDAEQNQRVWEAFDSKTMHWYGPDKHYWFKTHFTVPDDFQGKSLWLNVKTQIDEWDDGKNPQFLLFVNDIPVQGIDMNHREVCLEEVAEAGKVYHLGLQAYTGTLHSEFCLLVELMEVDRKIEQLYYDISVPLNGFSRMEPTSRARRELTKVLNDTINILDLRSPYSDSFYSTLDLALDYISQHLYKDLAGYQDITASCIGHTHIDVAWWWTVEQTREKVGRSFATVLKLMEEYPDYKFMSSQPQLYAFLKERYPDLYEKIKEKVDAKRWEPEGGMWVEADCNLTSGESLVRQFIYGKKFFKEEFGVDNRVLWLPDVFGYSGALPQIMKKSGIDYFMTTKLAWNQFNKIPNDTFVWRGIDGSEVLTHMVTTLGVGQDEADFFTTYNGMLHPDAIMGGWHRYQNKEINDDILISYGYGDGGGGPTREMLETAKRMDKGIIGIPRTRQCFSGRYFEELEKRIEDNSRLHTWEGELYFEYHRGTYTSMARNKRSNRKAELKLMDLELLSVMGETWTAYPKERIDALWRVVLLNQFHDILPGTSIKEVYEVTKKEYGLVDKELDELISERIKNIAGSGEGITLFNTCGFDRNDLVTLDFVNHWQDGMDMALADEEGNRYPVQQTFDGQLIAYVEDLPSKGYKTFSKVSGAVCENRLCPYGDYEISTPYYDIKLNEYGVFTSIFDKREQRELIQAGQTGNLFRMYEDKPIYYDNWDIDIYYTEKYWDLLEVEEIKWLEEGPVRAVLSITRKANASTIQQKICFYADHPRIDFETFVDWHEHQHLLKVHFPVDIHTDQATFDIQFGNVTRKTHMNTSWDRARFESCGQKWMDLSEGHYGVSLMNDCKYGHSVKDSNMALTLIKSGIEPNPTTDQEEHYFTYAIYPHSGDWKSAETVKQAYQLNQPVLYVDEGSTGDRYSAVSVNQPNVIIETVKKSEDGKGFVLRLYESENARTKAVLHLDRALMESVKGIYRCNLMEEEESTLTAKGQDVPFQIKPYEILTIKLQTK